MVTDIFDRINRMNRILVPVGSESQLGWRFRPLERHLTYEANLLSVFYFLRSLFDQTAHVLFLFLFDPP